MARKNTTSAATTQAPRDTEIRLAAAMTRAENMLAEILAGNTVALGEWISIQARFASYSWNNTMLILAQCQHATHVAGFKTWLSLGRCVRKGERGIMILAPRTWQRTVADAETGEESTIGGMRFVGTAVFDISQTEVVDAERAAQSVASRRLFGDEGDMTNDDALYGTLAAYAEREGLRIVRNATNLGHGVMGAYSATERAIYLTLGTTTNQQTKTLAHELAHHLEQRDYSDYLAHRADSETVAELVAHVVLAHAGVDSSAYSMPYVAGWAGNMAIVKRNMGAVAAIARQLIAVLDGSAGASAPADTTHAATIAAAMVPIA